MGMLDALARFDEHFKEGEVFTLGDAKIGPEIATSYGTDRPAQFKIAGKWYSIFGVALVNQIERMDDDDRKAMQAGQFRVKLVRIRNRSGNDVKQLVGPDWTPEQGTPEPEAF